MKIKLFIYFLIIVLVLGLFYIYWINNNKIVSETDSDFIPPPYSSTINVFPMESSTTTSLENGTSYINKTLGFSIDLPHGISLLSQEAELRRYEEGVGNNLVGQNYNYYDINFGSSDSNSDTYVRIIVEDTVYKNINEWTIGDRNFGRWRIECSSELEPKDMFGENVMFSYGECTTDEKYSTEHVFAVKNNKIYYINLSHIPNEDKDKIWQSFRFLN